MIKQIIAEIVGCENGSNDLGRGVSAKYGWGRKLNVDGSPSNAYVFTDFLGNRSEYDHSNCNKTYGERGVFEIPAIEGVFYPNGDAVRSGSGLDGSYNYGTNRASHFFLDVMPSFFF